MTKLCQATLQLIRANTPLNINEQVHINHERCPAGTDTKRRLYIKRTIDNVLAYCHHCGGHSVLKNNTRLTTSQIKDRFVKKYNTPTNDEVLLPDDIILDYKTWPVSERVFIRQWFEEPAIVANNISYSPSLGRVIFPYYWGGKCVFWQGRDVPKRTPLKWLTASSTHKPLGVYNCRSVSSTIVIVEDVISALYLRQCGVHSMCLYGTSLGEHQLNYLLDQQDCYGEVMVWLDADDAGRQGAVTVYNRLQTILPRHMQVSKTYAKQPKDLTIDEISNELKRI